MDITKNHKERVLVKIMKAVRPFSIITVFGCGLLGYLFYFMATKLAGGTFNPICTTSYGVVLGFLLCIRR